MVHGLFPIAEHLLGSGMCQTSCLDISRIQRLTPQGEVPPTPAVMTQVAGHICPHITPAPHSHIRALYCARVRNEPGAGPLVLRQDTHPRACSPPRSLSAPTGVRGGGGESSAGRSVSMSFDKVGILFLTVMPTHLIWALQRLHLPTPLSLRFRFSTCMQIHTSDDSCISKYNVELP